MGVDWAWKVRLVHPAKKPVFYAIKHASLFWCNQRGAVHRFWPRNKYVQFARFIASQLADKRLSIFIQQYQAIRAPRSLRLQNFYILTAGLCELVYFFVFVCNIIKSSKN